MDVTHRVPIRLNNWKRVSGVLCDRKMKPRGNVYRTVVRPALVYGADTLGIDEGTCK